ncbi:MAG: tetratricopeptide repeat protein, partial [Alphaproteobacteria bacterium]|nr:tetratricopeptide repeat protein [Alphaproteobacteria bacterium]
MRRAIAFVAVVGLCACTPPETATQGPMSLDEAQRLMQTLAASAGETERHDEDGQANWAGYQLATAGAGLVAIAERQPPRTDNPDLLAAFYLQRGKARRSIGRNQAAVADLELAARHGERARQIDRSEIHWQLYGALATFVSQERGLTELEKALALLPRDDGRGSRLRNPDRGPPRRVHFLAELVFGHARIGQYDKAEQYLAMLTDLGGRAQQRADQQRPAAGRPSLNPVQAAGLRARAILSANRGNYAEAEPLVRELTAVTGLPSRNAAKQMSRLHELLGDILVHLDRTGEAEIEFRRAIDIVAREVNTDPTDVVNAMRSLAVFLRAEGRWREAEALSRRMIELRRQHGGRAEGPVSIPLADVLAAQGRHGEALAIYDRIVRDLQEDAGTFRRFMAINQEWLMSLIEGGRAGEAVARADDAAQKLSVQFGPDHVRSAEMRALAALSRLRSGDVAAGLVGLETELPTVLRESASGRADADNRSTRDRLQAQLIDGLLAALATARPNDPAVAERGFALAQAAAGRSV